MSEALMTQLVIGRKVHYRLSKFNVDQINKARDDKHFGNPPSEGDECPMEVVKVWDQKTGLVNGQVILDGNDALWVTSVLMGNEPGTWHWPELC